MNFKGGDPSVCGPPTVTPPPACNGTYSTNFATNDGLQFAISNGQNNGYTIYSSANVAMKNGLTMTTSSVGCPDSMHYVMIYVNFAIDCGGFKYSGASWNTLKSYPYGTFTFTAKGTKTSGMHCNSGKKKLIIETGTGLSLTAVGSGQVLEQIAIVLSGDHPNRVNVSSWNNGLQAPETYFQVPFDISQVRIALFVFVVFLITIF